jgi:hypothetical protein
MAPRVTGIGKHATRRGLLCHAPVGKPPYNVVIIDQAPRYRYANIWGIRSNGKGRCHCVPTNVGISIISAHN